MSIVDRPLESVESTHTIATATKNPVATAKRKRDVASATLLRRVFDEARRSHLSEFVHSLSITEVSYVVKG